MTAATPSRPQDQGEPDRLDRPDQQDQQDQGSVRDDLARARTAVTEADLTVRVDERYVRAHLAAMRVAALVLTVRPCRVVGRRPVDLWTLLTETAPELAEWAGFFAATQPKREAVEAGGRYLVTPREADDLVRDVASFLGLVERMVDTLTARDGSRAVRAERRASA